jgi:hypothetical protein
MSSVNIKSDEQVCYNCKQMIWLVALGLGVRCRLETPPKMIPHLKHTCEKFEFKNKEENETSNN